MRGEWILWRCGSRCSGPLRLWGDGQRRLGSEGGVANGAAVAAAVEGGLVVWQGHFSRIRRGDVVSDLRVGGVVQEYARGFGLGPLSGH